VGEFVEEDTFLLDYFKGVGRVYPQEVQPFFERHGVPIKTILTDKWSQILRSPVPAPLRVFPHNQREAIEYFTRHADALALD